MTLETQRVGVYARHSTEKQNPRSSEDQIARCVEWVEARGGSVSVSLVWRDDAVTGRTTARQGLQAMLRAAESGRVDVVVVEDLSRVSRDAEDAHAIRKRLRFADVRLVSVSDGLDTSNAASGILFGVQAAMGEEYVRQLADKTRRGMQGRARAGKLTGAPPYGYRSEDAPDGAGKVAVIDAAQAAIVRRIFAERAAGASYGAITAGLNRDGIAPPRGRQSDSRKSRDGWALSGVRSMLHNERYAGVWTFGAKRWVRHPVTGKRMPRPGDESTRVELPETRIVDAETWRAVVEINSRTHRQWSKAGGVAKARRCYPLSGLLRCAACGGPMVINNGAWPQYRCDSSRGRGGLCVNRMSVRELDVRTTVLRETGRIITHDLVSEMIDMVHEELRAYRSQSRDDVDAARASLSETRRQIGRLVDLAATGRAPDAVLDRLRALEDQAARQSAHVDALISLSRSVPRLPDPDLVLSSVRDLVSLTDESDAESRGILAGLIGSDGVVLTPREGIYTATWSIGLGPILQMQTPPGTGREALATLTTANALGCGGPQCSALAPRIKALAEVERAA